MRHGHYARANFSPTFYGYAVTEIHEFSALELAARIRNREVSAVEVAEHTAARAEQVGPRVGAFITTTPELALEQARAADELLGTASRASAEVPPLLGVPCPIKDLTPVAGVRYTAGSAALADYIATEDTGVVTLLREAGTLMVGKTNTPEFGLPPYTEPEVAPPARTPWDLTRGAGGSSGGAAAAVSARIVPAAHASDGGGSIRIPAASCGLVGLKPSRGLISSGPNNGDGLGLSTEGVITRTVRDTAAFLDVLSRPWPGEVYNPPRPATSFLAACDEPVQPLRIGVITDPIVAPEAAVHPEAIRGVETAAAALEALGHTVSAAPVPFAAEEWEAFVPMWATMALSAPLPPEAEDLLRPLTRVMREQGRAVSGIQLFEAITVMQRLTRVTAQRWANFDLIMCPSLAQPPAPVGSIRDDSDPLGDFQAQKEFTPWSSLWNLTGGPAISLPLHWASVEDGGPELPFGVLLGGTPGQEPTLLALGSQLEEALPWHTRTPILK